MFYHSMRFDFDEDAEAIRDTAHRWAQDRVKPMAAEIDRENNFPAELWKEMGDLGLLGVTVGGEYGERVVEIAHACPAIF
ncbi:MAG: acyl-CoA dehydrogenase family protein, partial [Pseudomonadota bacterium]